MGLLAFYSPISILETVTKPLGSDHLGPVESGLIRLVGLLMTLSFRNVPCYIGRSQPYENKIHGKFHLENVSHDTDESPKRLHCLPVAKCFDKDGKYRLKCLILRPVDNRRGTFQRWGIMHFVDFGHFDVPRGEPNSRGIIDPLWDEIQNEDWLEFEVDHGDGRYTITII